MAKPELAAVCSVGCCYHLLSEEFDPAGQGNHTHMHTHFTHFLGGNVVSVVHRAHSPHFYSLRSPFFLSHVP